MAMSKFGTYDDDYATVGQVKSIVTGDVSILEGQVNTLPKSYGTQPQPPYTRGSTYVDSNGKLYTCVTPRSVGEFNQSDWIESVPSDKIIQYANNSPETSRIGKNKLDADIITTQNLSAQTISCGQLSGGTISGQTISGGTISGANLTATQGSIGGWGIDGTSGITSGNSAVRPNGSLALYFTGGGGGVYRINNGVRLNAGAGVCIGSATNGNLSMPTNNGVDVKGCSGNEVYIGCMANSDGTTQKGAVRVRNGEVLLVADGTIYANGVAIGGSSSKATKTKIRKLSKKNKKKVYDLLKNIPIKQYDYKKKYGKKHNYGFLIEDIENTELNELLHITKHDTDKNIKTYCTEDLVRLQLIAIQELMKKVDYLENKLQEQEEKKCSK